MTESFADILRVGGKSNSLGRAEEVVATVLGDQRRLEELYRCLSEDDAWLRMRAADALEKVCRERPDWLRPYVDRLLGEVADIRQPSVQWHLAQMMGEIELTSAERQRAIQVLTRNLDDDDVDWIVAAHSMETLAHYVRSGNMQAGELTPLLQKQQAHRSKSVVKRAARLLSSLNGTVGR